jgi:hypothetical protein
MRVFWAIEERPASARPGGRRGPVGRSVPAPRSGLKAAGLKAAIAYACATGAATLLAGAPARADVFSPIGLVSYGAVGGGAFVQQAEYAHDSAISADGRYVAFDGSVGGVTGVWRRDLATEVIEQVAGGDAAMPSISEDGRYVSFTTNEGASLPEITHALPDVDPHAEAVNVYRRDMSNRPAATAAEEAARPAEERAFQAASAPSGSEESLRYASSAEREHGGSYAVGRTAMSANGDEVAFVTASVSNLVAYPALEEEERARGETPAPHTPAGQVAVRRFDSGTTELVSRCRFECGQGAAAGAAEPVVAGEAESKPVGAVALGSAAFPAHGRAGSWPGASISADGTAVAWMGEDVAQQAPTLAQEGLESAYQEPLWRRLPAAANQARRVTGGSDPEAPACAASGEVALARGSESASDPCQGPFVRETATVKGPGLIKGPADDDTPRLSANGEEVVFGANARLIAEGSDFDRGEDGNPTDLFVVNMRPGLTRTQAITALTQAGTSEAQGAEVTDFEISPDGAQVAFSTIRTLFVLGLPTLVSAPSPEVAIGELYDADLADGTLTRVTHGYELEGEQSQQPHPTSTESGDPYKAVGNPNELGALTPDFSGNGDELVFTSTAANLVYGDGNSPAKPVSCCQAGDGSDVFAVTRRRFVPELAPQSISPPPFPLITPAWLLGVTARASADGSVMLYVEVPGAGRLEVAARGGIVLTERASGHGRRSRRHARRRRTLVTRTVATGKATEASPAGGLMEMAVRLQRSYAPLAGRSGGLPASLRVSFSSPGRPTLEQTLAVTFRRTPHAGRRAGAAGARPRRHASSASHRRARRRR